MIKAWYKKYKRFKRQADNLGYALKNGYESKIFCIGFNKTGTTSVKKSFQDHGFKVGNQAKAELLLPNYIRQDYNAIISYCMYYKAFQDIPFSYRHTYKNLDKAFPGSKFILTVRDNEDQWYNSLTRFHQNILNTKSIPTARDLKEADYRYKGFFYDSIVTKYGTSDSDPYNYNILTDYYSKHIEEVRDYFKDREQDLIIINLSDRGSYKRMCDFLNVSPLYDEFPWQNRTKSIESNK